jgi:hypothetical protein
MKKTLLLLIFLLSEPCLAGEYSDCILENMKGVNNGFAANQIKIACKRRHCMCLQNANISTMSIAKGFPIFLPLIFSLVLNNAKTLPIGQNTLVTARSKQPPLTISIDVMARLFPLTVFALLWHKTRYHPGLYKTSFILFITNRQLK